MENNSIQYANKRNYKNHLENKTSNTSPCFEIIKKNLLHVERKTENSQPTEIIRKIQI